MEEKKITTLQIVILEMKIKVKPLKAVSYNIDSANYCVLTMMQYVH